MDKEGRRSYISFRGKKVLVTGGAGFIGSHIVDRLLFEGASVVVFDNLSAGNIANLRDKNSLGFIRGDLRNEFSVMKITRDIDIIFHFGANASVPYSIEHARYDFETNAIGTFNLLTAAMQSDVEKIIYASSAAIYGEPRYVPMDEDHPLYPKSPYGASKLAGEKLGLAYKETYGLDFVSARIFNVYGPRQPRYIVYDFIHKLKKDPKALDVLGSGIQVRDYCYIDDMVDALILIAEKGKGIYNAAGGKPTEIWRLAELIVSLISPEAKIRYGGKTWKGDIDVLHADITRLRNLGFTPKTELEEGIKKTIAWFEGN